MRVRLPYRDLAVMTALELLTTRRRRGGGWVLKEKVSTAMYGSGEQHEAWIFSRRPSK
jgi:hypothetical protein